MDFTIICSSIFVIQFFFAYAKGAVSIPPLLVEGPMKGELLFVATYDPHVKSLPLQIPCRADGLPPPSYSWLKDGEVFDLREEGGRIEMVDGEGTITIHRPITEDEGTYQCIAENGAGIAYSDIIHVEKTFIGSFPKTPLTTLHLTEGQPIAIPCQAPIGYPKPKNPDGSLRNLQSQRISVDDEGTLRFTEVKMADASKNSLYACAAFSSGRGEYKVGNWAFLNVTKSATPPGAVPVPMHVSSKEITLLKGDDAKLFCIHSGFPSPSVRWWRRLKPKSDEELDADGGVLELQDLTEDNDGKYFCQATNEKGNGPVHQFNINVDAEPEFLEEPEPTNSPPGETVSFSCRARGKPKPTIYWTRNGLKIDHHGNQLVFKNVDEGDRGAIACNASNIHGYVYATAFLNVLSLPPQWITELTNEKAERGSRVELICEVFGSPDPTISWARLVGKKEIFIREETVDFQLEKNALIIKYMDVKHVGPYACKAANKYGAIVSKAKISLLAPPDPPRLTHVECIGDQAKLRWETEQNETDASGFVIQFLESKHSDEWRDFDDQIAADFREYSVTLHAGNTYAFRILAHNAVGTSDPSNVAGNCHLPGLPPRLPPSNMTVQGNITGTLLVTWQPISPDEHNGEDFHYKMLWREYNDGFGGDEDNPEVDDGEDWNSTIIDDWQDNEFLIENLLSFHPYEVQLEAHNVYGKSPLPASSIAFSGEDVPLNSPSNIRVTDVTSSSAVVTWSAVTAESVRGFLKGYRVQYWRIDSKWNHRTVRREIHEDDDNEEEDDKDYVFVAANQNRAVLPGLAAFTRHGVHVCVINSMFAGPYSRTLTFRTKEGVAGPVTDLTVRPLSSTSLLINWREPSESHGVVRGYLVEYLRGDQDDGMTSQEGEVTSQEEGVVSRRVGVNETTVKLSELDEEAEYEVTVAAINDAGEGEKTTVLASTQETASTIPPVPIFTWDFKEQNSVKDLDRDDDGDIDEDDVQNRHVIIGDTDGDGDVDLDDVLDTDGDGDIDDKDVAVADIDNDGDVDIDDVKAADRDGDGDVDISDIGDEDGDGDFDGADVLAADEDGDGDVDAADDNEERILLEDRDNDGDIDLDDVIDVDGDGDIDDADIGALDIDNDGDVDSDDLHLGDKDGDGDIDAADVIDLDGDGDIDINDLEVKDKNGDGVVDTRDVALRNVFLADIDNDGDIDEEDVLDLDNDGDIDGDDFNLADVDNDGDIDLDDVRAADKDNDGDVDIHDIGDKIKDGDIDRKDILAAGTDFDGKKDVKNTLMEDKDGDGDFDLHDISDIDGDGDIDEDDIEAADIDKDGDVDINDLRVADLDGDGDVDKNDVIDANSDGEINIDDIQVVDRDGDGDIDRDDFKAMKIFLSDTNGDGDIDLNDVLDNDGDGDVDELDIRAADVDNDGDVDRDDVKFGDKDGDGDIDYKDVKDLDGDGRIDADDLNVVDRDGDGDIDKMDYVNKNIFLADTDGDGDIDIYDVLDTDGDGDIDQEDIDVADIDNDGDVDEHDIAAGDRDKDGDVDFADIGDEDNDGDIDGDDVVAADEDGDGDIDSGDDNGEFIILTDRDRDGDIDANDVTDLDGDGDVDKDDHAIADIDNDGDVDLNDVKAADVDGDCDIDGADVPDIDGDGDIDGRDVLAADRDGDGDIDARDLALKNVFLKDVNDDGIIDASDVLDLDGNGVIDENDHAIADVDNNGVVDVGDVLAGDRDNDGDIDVHDIGDADGDGDIDGDDVLAADKDNDGDIDAADIGEGIDVDIRWHPDITSHPGVDFYVQHRIKGDDSWRSSRVERRHLYHTLKGLDPSRSYEVRIVALNGEFETPSEAVLIKPTKVMPSADSAVDDVMDDGDPMMWTWFIVAVIVAVTMMCIVFFSMWVHKDRLKRVAELRSALYGDVESSQTEAAAPMQNQVCPPTPPAQEVTPEEVVEENEVAIQQQRQNLAAMLRRQETSQSVDSFASQEDDFAEYGDETMGPFNADGSLVHVRV